MRSIKTEVHLLNIARIDVKRLQLVSKSLLQISGSRTIVEDINSLVVNIERAIKKLYDRKKLICGEHIMQKIGGQGMFQFGTKIKINYLGALEHPEWPLEAYLEGFSDCHVTIIWNNKSALITLENLKEYFTIAEPAKKVMIEVMTMDNRFYAEDAHRPGYFFEVKSL